MTVSVSPIRRDDQGNRTLEVYGTSDDLFFHAAESVSQTLQNALKLSGQAAIALSGGSTPKRLYEILAQGESGDVDWQRVQIFFCDERNVGPNQADSNYRMVQETLLAGGNVPTKNVHRIQGELQASEAALRYEAEMRDVLPVKNGMPIFDLLLLGLGPDGHTASLFPGSPALDESKKWVFANWVERLKANRITLTFPVLNQAANILFLVSGNEKREISRHVLLEKNTNYPAQRICPVAGRLTWLLDAAAAKDYLPTSA